MSLIAVYLCCLILLLSLFAASYCCLSYCCLSYCCLLLLSIINFSYCYLLLLSLLLLSFVAVYYYCLLLLSLLLLSLIIVVSYCCLLLLSLIIAVSCCCLLLLSIITVFYGYWLSTSSVRRLLRRNGLTEQERCSHAYCSSSTLRLTPDQYRRCLTMPCVTQSTTNIVDTVSPVPRVDSYGLISLPMTLRTIPSDASLTSIRPLSFLPSFRPSLREPTIVCPPSSLTGEQLLKYCTRTECFAISSPRHTSSAPVLGVKPSDVEKLFSSIVRGGSEADKTEFLEGSVCVRSRFDNRNEMKSSLTEWLQLS